MIYDDRMFADANLTEAQWKAVKELEAKLAEFKAARIAYASEFDGDVGSIHQNIRGLKKELADRDKAATEYMEMFGREKKRAEDAESRVCSNCKGERWVCENHSNVPWDSSGNGCCGGAGSPCPECNPANYKANIADLEKELKQSKDREGLADFRGNRLESEVGRLREALEEYGHHERDCDSLQKSIDGAPFYLPCTCGFEKALSPAPAVNEGEREKNK